MSSSRHTDAIVIGGGIIGASIIYHLSLRGLKPLLIERGVVGQGATSYSGGIVRVFHLNSELSDLAAASFPFYKNLESRAGDSCAFHTTGFLYFPSKDKLITAETEVERLKACINIGWLFPDQVKALNKNIRVESPAIYEPDAGYMVPRDVTRALVKSAKKRGASVNEGTQVTKLIRSNNKFVGVETSHGVIYSEKIVVALGANSPDFMLKHGVDLSLWSQKIQVDIRQFHEHAGEKAHPAWIDDVHDLNGRPAEDGQILLGYPTHDRNYFDGYVSGTAQHSASVEEFGRRRFDWIANTGRSGSYASFDCYSKQGTGLAAFVDEQESLIVATGFSGGGFKLAPEIGRRVSSLFF